MLIRVAPDAPVIRLLVYVPNNRRGPAPVFLGMNFDGNHTVDADPGITLVDAWTWDPKTKTASLTKADPAKRVRVRVVGNCRWCSAAGTPWRRFRAATSRPTTPKVGSTGCAATI
ncbi:MAG: hypothetical protein QM775_19180 [Pirellulales bacterium]